MNESSSFDERYEQTKCSVDCRFVDEKVNKPIKEENQITVYLSMVADEHFLDRFHAMIIIHHVFYDGKEIRPEKYTINFFTLCR